MSILTSRKHWIYKYRETQMRRNKLAVNGGRPYVDERLWRAPNETDTSWEGEPGRGIVGRKERTALVNDAGRVARKINQYIFKESAVRNGGDESFLKNCTGDGESVHAFMQRVNTSITHGRWCWLQCDRAPIAEGQEETLADKAPVKWILWNAVDVPDWCFNADGSIKWLITRSHVYINDKPMQDAQDGELFTLYYMGDDGNVYITEETNGKITLDGLRKDVVLPGLKRIPFVCVGKPVEDAWWFDDVENMQAQVLNLDSQHNETLTETVYPQLVVPTSLSNSLEAKLTEKNIDGKRVAALVRELTLGRKIPICESGEDKGISRYIVPQGEMKLLVDEGNRKRGLLFDIAGLALFNKETRQVQTAESKQFDQLDTNSTLKNRAIQLQESETAMVELTKVFDPGFKGWEPEYPSDFDVTDVAALGAALQVAGNMPDKTPKMRKLLAKAQVKVLKELAQGIATDDEIEEVLKEIDEHDFEKQDMLPNPFAPLAGEEGEEDDPDDPDKKPKPKDPAKDDE